VRSNDSIIVLLDTATGDLYNAIPSDIKPYANRPRGLQPSGFGNVEQGFPRAIPKVKPALPPDQQN
jgi:hypothetical protein